MTKANVYEQFDSAFKRVSAYTITKGAEHVGRVCIKHPADGVGRLYAYVQVWGAPMVREWAGGYGYDKVTAAVASACGRLAADCSETAEHVAALQTIRGSGHSWADQLRALGYTVQHVI